MATLDYQNPGDAPEQFGFFRSVFGPSKKEVWKQLATGIDGRFVSGGFFGRDKVVMTTGNWTITLDTYTVHHHKNGTTYTRMRAPYVNADGLRFTIYRAGIFSALGEMIGMSDIKIGDAAFDEAFVINGTDEQKVGLLLSNPDIRTLLQNQPRIRIEVKDDEGWFGTHFPADVDELYFHMRGVIRDLEQLRGLFELFSAILHQLRGNGSAAEADPRVEL